MKKKEFWNIVKRIDWKNNLTYKNVTTEEEGKYLAIAIEYRKRLQDAILQEAKKNKQELGEFVGRFVGDDAFWDLTAHVVGLGKGRYFAVLHNPSLIRKYSHSYKENFEYCFYH